MSDDTYEVAQAGDIQPLLPPGLREDPEVYGLWEKTLTRFPSALRKVSPDDILRGLVLPMELVRTSLLDKPGQGMMSFRHTKRDVVVVGHKEFLQGHWRFHDLYGKSIPRLEGGWDELHGKGVIVLGDTLLLEFIPDSQIIGIKALLRSPRSPQKSDFPASEISPSLCLSPGMEENQGVDVTESPSVSDQYSSDNTVSALCSSWDETCEASVSPPGQLCDHTHVGNSTAYLAQDASNAHPVPASSPIENCGLNYCDSDPFPAQELNIPSLDNVCPSSCLAVGKEHTQGKEDLQRESISTNPHVQEYYLPPHDSPGPSFCGPSENNDYSSPLIHQSVPGDECRLPEVDNIRATFIVTLKEEDFEHESVLRVRKEDVQFVEQHFGTPVEKQMTVEYTKCETYVGTVEVTAGGEWKVHGCWQKVLQAMKVKVKDAVICKYVSAGKLIVEKYT